LWQPDRVHPPDLTSPTTSYDGVGGSAVDGAVRGGGRLLQAATAAGAVGAAGLTYGWLEARWFTLLRETLPVLPPGSPEIRVLHVSDLHLTPRQRRKRDWIASLAELEPDLVVDTGDNLAHRDAVDPLVESFGALLDVPGVFVQGSNDYFEPTFRNPVAYLLPDNGRRRTGTPQLPWREMVRRFTDAGWTDLTNRRAELTVKGVRIAFAGVDDPHLGYDDLDAVAGPAPTDPDLRVAVAHAPYLRVLDQFAADGYDAILAGHTHGGQVCLPVRRAIVTNCDLESARASGLSTHPAQGDPAGEGTSWLHVCPGAGTSPYAVVRFCCRPAASLLTLTPRG
jgi:predicted MPP superfamily phosphohydrolase